MLNIPDEVKALFKRDDIYKNFRVHFPNGETSDFDNSSVLTESVKFTESICSQQSFRFGLTEASEIQFTAVNIPNIRGVTIECAMDIDVSSLGMTWINANLSEGDPDFLDETCYLNVAGNGGFYRVPYGRFIVDTCPRNHESMWKREITAYTERLDVSADLNAFPARMLNQVWDLTDYYSPHVKALANSIIFNENPSSLPSVGYTSESVPIASVSGAAAMRSKRYETSGHGFWFYFLSNGKEIPYNHSARTTTTGIIEIGREYYDETALINACVSVLEEKFSSFVVPSQFGFDTWEDLARDGIKGMLLPIARFSHLVPISSSSTTPIVNSFDVPSSTSLIYPAGMTNSKNALYSYSNFNVYVMDQIMIGTAVSSDATVVTDGIGASYVNLWTDNNPTSAAAEMTVRVEPTLSTTKRLNVGGGTEYDASAFFNSLNLADFVEGYLELECRFGKASRSGGLDVIGLDNTNPISIIPSEYSSLWYDETSIAPIGYVKVSFLDSSEQSQDATIQIGDGASVYDMTGNAVLSNLVFTLTDSDISAQKTIEDKVKEFLDDLFTPNIPDLSFIPIELEKKGLPYLEAGDAIEVETEDGQTVPSFILRQTISGIQYLSADVESANGEAMEIIES